MSIAFPAAAALLLAAAPAAAAGLAPGSAYVAMGSSYAAGAGIGPLQPGSPPRCGRNSNNYPALLAARLGLRLVDASCSGATTAHVLGPWNELPAQIAAVTPDTGLVTITVGGNDLGLMGWMFAGSCRAGVGQGPCRTATMPDAAAEARLETNLGAIAAAVKARAPAARLVFVLYPRLLSARPCAAETIDAQGAAGGRAIAARLAAITRRAARAHGAGVLDIDRASRRHTPCAAQPWTNGLATGQDPARGAAWHPNAAGHAAIADRLAAYLAGG